MQIPPERLYWTINCSSTRIHNNWCFVFFHIIDLFDIFSLIPFSKFSFKMLSNFKQICNQPIIQIVIFSWTLFLFGHTSLHDWNLACLGTFQTRRHPRPDNANHIRDIPGHIFVMKIMVYRRICRTFCEKLTMTNLHHFLPKLQLNSSSHCFFTKSINYKF